jgi:formamidopyrimidine-DNA glycosylase
MPELPEVTTTVNGLQRVLPSLRISDVWTDLAKKKVSRKDFEHTIKSQKFFDNFKKLVIGAKVINVERRAKNILINLNNGYTILIHLKMTGHLIYGDYVYNKKINPPAGGWLPHKNERISLHDPYNRFVHVVFTFNNKKHLAFCDSRKFGKVTILETKDAHNTIHLKGVGPEPLEENFTFTDFKNVLMKKPNWPMKQILMDQYTIAGIGNIYSDEMLWLASIHPESRINKIPDTQLKDLFKSMKQVLNKGIDFGGDSMSDYRDINGERGKFQNHHNVYQKKNEKCGKKGCAGVIIRSIIGGRSAHYCPAHQKLFK